MTEPYSGNQNEWTERPGGTERVSATEPSPGAPSGGVDRMSMTEPPDGVPSGGGAFAQLPGGIPLLGGKYLAQARFTGGMGVVYKCVKKSTGQVVALKTVLSDGPMTEEEIRSMRRNYDRVHALSHDHVVRVNALEVDDRTGQWYVEMDWVEGESLEGRYRQFGGDMRLVSLDLVRVLRQVAEALDYAHGHGVVHRDVKDANIMIEKATGGAVLIDFGIASRAHRAGGADATSPHHVTATTASGVFAGTRGYQSPEQWRGEPAVAASDEYSLAVTAYRCLSGHLPFWSVNEGELQEMVLNADVPSVTSLPDAANNVLRKGLSKVPSDRYGTCRAFVDALEQGLSSLTGGVAQPRKTDGEASFSMAEFFMLSGHVDEINAESRKREWDRGQTFGDHLDAFGNACRGAKAATEYKNYAVAYDLYKQAEGEWKWLEDNGSRRASASARREKATKAREAARTVEAERLAKAAFDEAVNQLKTAEGVFESGRFEDAEKGFASAEAAFAQAEAAARLARRKADWETSVKEAIAAKRFDDARKSVAELKKLDEEKAALVEAEVDSSETAWKSERLEQLEKNIRKAVEEKRFEDARQAVAELKELDAAKATTWEAAIDESWKADRIALLEQSISRSVSVSVSTKRFDDARQSVAELKKLDAAKAASWEVAIKEAWKADRMEKLETSIRMAKDAKRFDDARQFVAELKELDAEKGALLEAAVDSAETAWKAERVRDLEENISQAIAAKSFQGARLAVDELKELDASKAASWEAAIDEADAQENEIQKAKRIEELETSIQLAKDAKHFDEARQNIAELKELDETKAASWEDIVTAAEGVAKRKARRLRLTGIAAVVAVVGGLLAIWLRPIKPTVQEDAGNYVVTLKPGVTITLMKVEAGSFKMGSEEGDSDERPVHTVMLTEDFWLEETEVTQAEYEAVMGKNPSRFKNGGDYPVESVSWDDAKAFCDRLNQLFKGQLPSGYQFGLPTEAQWEYAARGGPQASTRPKADTRLKYSGDLNSVGWYDGNSGDMTHPVRRKNPNALGLYDMSGNVWELCRDWYGSYPAGAVTDPLGPSNGSFRVFRGGSWYNVAGCCRSTCRSRIDPSNRGNLLGFRVALVPVR